MNRVFLIYLALIIVLVSCTKNETWNEEIDQICEFKKDIISPIGYEINSIGKIDFNGSVRSFQFVNEQTGYAILTNNIGGYVEMFKTTNSGETWKDLKIGIDKYPVGMVFKDENIGIITTHDVTGCPPPNCQNKCVLIKTVDGGITWVEKEIKQLKGVLHHPQFDSEGNLYALLTLNNEATLMKSKDDGESWESFFISSELGFELVTFSFKIFKDNFYISGKGGKIFVVGSKGDLVKTIETANSNIWDLELIDENIIIVVNSGKVIKSNDGGDTWNTIYSKSARMIGFNSQEIGLMFLQKSACPTDVYQVNDLIGSTTNGGLNWIEADETTTNLHANFKNSQKRNNDHWYFMIENKLLGIEKK
jgi:photosystem II stability/assembly factor-like uncharacterized protein